MLLKMTTSALDLKTVRFLIAVFIFQQAFGVADSSAYGQLITKLTQTCTSDASKYRSENVTRYCNANGTWETISLASKCNALPLSVSSQNLLKQLTHYNISLTVANTVAPTVSGTATKTSLVLQLMSKLVQSCTSDKSMLQPSEFGLTDDPPKRLTVYSAAKQQRFISSNIDVTNENFTRQCFANGTWKFANLSSVCVRLPAAILDKNFLLLLKKYNLSYPTPTPKTTNYHAWRQVKIFIIMQWISFGIMVPSLMLLFIFPNLNDDRMILHRCLVISFLLSIATFLPDYYLKLSTKNPTACNALWILNRLFAMCEVSWMFNEGVFLLKTIVFVFSQKSYMWLFFLVGWGFPIMLTLCIWTPIMASKVGQLTTRCWTHNGQDKWMLIIYVPMTVMLAVNMFILIYVIGIVISKLKQSNSADFQSTRKAAKGAIVLMPLLGAIYLMIFYAPSKITWYNYFLVIAQPLQGILVCIVHVFLNKDIHSAIKNKLRKITNNTNLFNLAVDGAQTVKKRASITNTTTRNKISKRISLSELRRKKSSRVLPECASIIPTNNNEKIHSKIEETKADANANDQKLVVAV
eukprot:gene3417-3908_t